ncbi:hypothetical protein [Pseudofrankia sp. BMG5.36]|nr:hypothetical protein [Pseudofrankia sp. BMG5.36]
MTGTSGTDTRGQRPGGGEHVVHAGRADLLAERWPPPRPRS